MQTTTLGVVVVADDSKVGLNIVFKHWRSYYD